MAVVLDIIEGARARVVNGRFEELVRVAKVDDLAGDASGRLLDAVSASGMPATGSAHPDNPLLELEEKNPRSDGRTDGCEVELVYRRRTFSGDSTSKVRRRSGSAAIQQIQTTRDKDGQQIVLSHAGGENANPTTAITDRGIEISVFQPTQQIRYQIEEVTTDPETLSLQWSGYVNSTSFKGKPAGYWLCSVDNYDEYGDNWLFDYSLQGNPQLWLPIAVLRDAETQEPVQPLVDGQSIKTVPWYEQRDFNDKFNF